MNTIQTRWLDSKSAVLEGNPSAPPPPTRRPPCADHPDTWDLDSGSPDSWRLAVRICGECPLLMACQDLARTLTERGYGPRAMIWAGIGYDNSGKIVDDLDRYRGAMSEPRRPFSIIRRGPEQVRSEPVIAAPPRRIILGRALPLTGTDAC